MNKELDFVARYYRKGTLDVGKAYRRTLEKAGRRSSVRQWIAVGSVEPRRVSNAPSVNAVAAWATHEFHFSATPLSVVLRDLSDYYGVTLTCAGGEGKRLTADFHADSVTTIVGLIDETLDVRIKIGRK